MSSHRLDILGFCSVWDLDLKILGKTIPKEDEVVKALAFFVAVGNGESQL